ncbi:hypothetical protein QYE76_061203 [Lolium multiflorum]|uniref:Uncharacterized protein n=1 Tax=Lolium multiflorum TaxID=4521 RepID=A0AAD8W507_LOLMU|nr:hypothetical protein QYE76_061203 [Lolium multiflorum]
MAEAAAEGGTRPRAARGRGGGCGRRGGARPRGGPRAANINAAIEERLADLTRVTKEHETTAGRPPPFGDLSAEKNEAARYASSPSPHPDALARAARPEDADSAERGRQAHAPARRQGGGQAPPRPGGAHRVDASPAGGGAMREADDSAAGGGARRARCADGKEEDEGLRRAAAAPRRPARGGWNPHAYGPPASSEIHGPDGERRGVAATPGPVRI